MNRGRQIALATGSAASLICASVFWLIWQTSTSQTFFSFWNRPLAVRTGLTVLFVIFGSRAVIWHTYKVSAYRVERGRGSIRILPLSFGLAVFAMVTVWLVVTTLAETFYRGYRLLVATAFGQQRGSVCDHRGVREFRGIQRAFRRPGQSFPGEQHLSAVVWS